MLTTNTSFRSSPRVIAADYLADGPKIILLGCAAVATRIFEGSAVSTLLAWVSLIYLVVLVVEPPLRYYFNRYTIGPDALAHESGLLLYTERSIPWVSVTAVEVEKPWGHRLLRISRVTVVQANSDESRVVLRGVGDGVVTAVCDRVTRGSAAMSLDQVEAEVRPSAVLLHRAGTRELIIMSFTHGQAILLGFTVMLAAWDLADQSGLLGTLGGLLSLAPLYVVLVVGPLVGLLIGIVATIVRYHDFRVERVNDRQIITRYGLIGRRERRLDSKNVLGVVVHQNLVELMLGHARLGVLTMDAQARMTTNIILPSARLQSVETLARQHFGNVWTDSDHQSRPALSAAGKAAIMIFPLVAVAMLLLLADTPRWATLLTVAAMWTLIRLAGLGWATDMALDAREHCLVVTTKLSYVRRTCLQLRAVHGVGEARWRSRPKQTWWAWATAFAGGPRVYLSLGPATSEIERITAILTAPEFATGRNH